MQGAWRKVVTEELADTVANYIEGSRLFAEVTRDRKEPYDLVLEGNFQKFEIEREEKNETVVIEVVPVSTKKTYVSATIEANFTLRRADGQVMAQFPVSLKASPQKAEKTGVGYRAPEETEGERSQRDDAVKSLVPQMMNKILSEIRSRRTELAVLVTQPKTPIGAPELPREGAPVRQRWAVVIGISKYAAQKEIPPLRFADKDAEMFYNFLLSSEGGEFPKDHVLFLKNESATYRNIREAFFEFLKQAVAEDFVIIYFAGHGAPDPTKEENMYLLTYDTDPKQLAASAFPMWDLETALVRSIASERLVVFADACHSAGLAGEVGKRSALVRNNVHAYFQRLSQTRPGRVIFTSSDGYEVSQESERWGDGHGVFTWFLMQGLKGEADEDHDGVVTLGEILSYVDINVRRETQNAQHPNKTGSRFDRSLPLGIVKGQTPQK
jgi:uncharacterized caspase-like protein